MSAAFKRPTPAIEPLAAPAANAPAPGEVEAGPKTELKTGAERRGPFRPDRLVSTRQRLRGDVIWLTFFALDALLLGVVAITCAQPWRQGLGLPSTLLAAAPQGAETLLCLIGLRAARAYDLRAKERPARHLARVVAAMTGAGGVLCVALVLTHAPRPVVVGLLIQLTLGAMTLLAAHTGWLALVRRWRRRGYLTPNVVVVGATENARRLIEAALHDGEVAVLGVFDDRHARAPDAIAGVPVLGDVQALVGHRMMPFVDRVVIAVDPKARTRIAALVERLGVLPNDISLIVDWGAKDQGAALDRLTDAPLSRLSSRGGGAYRRRFAKRAQDLVLGGMALALTTPLMLGIALAVKLDSPGPVFFRQKRQGFNNEPIIVWKFRSLHHAQRDERALKQVRYDDPRITRVGRIIRRTSLDELPQLFNVLSGEMSLVGPRPHAPEMRTGQALSAQLVAHYAHRHRMKPGMTGWAAIHGSRGPVDSPELVRRRVALDMDYIERQSLWLDLYIMAMTLPCLLGDKLNLR